MIRPRTATVSLRPAGPAALEGRPGGGGRRWGAAVPGSSGPAQGPWPLPRRSGWFPEAYVKPLEQVPGSPLSPASPVTSLNPANELPSRYLPGVGRWRRQGEAECHTLGAWKVIVSIPLPPCRRSLALTPSHPGPEKEAGGCSGDQQMGWGHQGRPLNPVSPSFLWTQVLPAPGHPQP